MLYFHKFSERHEVYNEKIRERGFSFTNTVSISSTFDLAFSSQLQIMLSMMMMIIRL